MKFGSVLVVTVMVCMSHAKVLELDQRWLVWFLLYFYLLL